MQLIYRCQYVFFITKKHNLECENVYFLKAIRHFEREEYNSALIYANSSLQLNPKLIEAGNTKALLLQFLGREKEAISCYLEGLKINVKDVVIRENLLSLLFTSIFNNTIQGEKVYNSLTHKEQHQIQTLLK